VAKSAADQARAGGGQRGGYFEWSRDPAVGLFAVLPLWLLYEVLRLCLAPAERNGAEVLLLQGIDQFGWRGLLILRAAFVVLVVFSAWSLVARKVPWLRVAAVVVLEGTVYGLLLGPSAAALTSGTARLLECVQDPAANELAANLVGSLGAGIFEELVFRLGLMSAIVWLSLRAVRAWSMPKWIAGAVGVVGSALVFSWFHHLCGEPYDRARFLFRTMAGILLGLLMWFRGYGVCVYTHALYDVHYYLTQPE
jgi:hypothetical protein